jgi:hypothetical protein
MSEDLQKLVEEIGRKSQLRWLNHCLEMKAAGHTWAEVERRYMTTRRTITARARELGVELPKKIKNMSDTPRTEDAIANVGDAGFDDDLVSADFARQLERELNEAKADRQRLREALSQAGAGQFLRAVDSTPPPPVVAKADADALAEALNDILSEVLTCACGECYACENFAKWDKLTEDYKKKHAS